MAELRHVAIGGVVGFCKYEWLMAKNDRQPGIKIQTSFQRGFRHRLLRQGLVMYALVT
jgi:hypothetical protein